MSGAFATRTLEKAQETITALMKKREELRAYVVEEGNDPPEITEWTWSRNAAGAS
jgi:phosphoketolase